MSSEFASAASEGQKEFSRRFIRRVVGDVEVEHVIYGLRARDYAARVAPLYWEASLKIGAHLRLGPTTTLRFGISNSEHWRTILPVNGGNYGRCSVSTPESFGPGTCHST